MKIFLIGFMGAGKTFNGQLLAQALDFDFFDLDELIEAAEGQTINKIFEESGEAYFREKEAEVLRNIKAPNVVIACGGGTACFKNNMKWMNENGTSIYLKCSVNLLAVRLLQKQAARPLLNNLSRNRLYNTIKTKLATRKEFYEAAQFQVYQSVNNEKVIPKLVALF